MERGRGGGRWVFQAGGARCSGGARSGMETGRGRNRGEEMLGAGLQIEHMPILLLPDLIESCITWEGGRWSGRGRRFFGKGFRTSWLWTRVDLNT